MKKNNNTMKEENVLKNLTKEQLITSINQLANKNPSFKQDIEEVIKKNKSNFEDENNYFEYNSLWDEAEEIISKFNEYGGGPEDEEEIVYKNLPKIVELFNKSKLDEATKKEFINNCFEQYYCGNSGFEDLLRDSIFDVCNCKEDWLLVIEKLKKSGSDYDAECIIKIYRDNINDNETYLKLRMADLHYGLDYYGLVEYYNKKGETGKAVEIAKEGIEKGEGRIIDLIEFLLGIYTKKKGYGNILKYKILSFKEDPSLEKYTAIREFSNISDIKKILNELDIIISNSRDEELKAEINYHNRKYNLVLEYIKKNQEADFLYITRFKEWAQKLEPHFPRDLLKIYRDKVMHILEYKVFKEYSAAGYYLRRIRLIFSDIEHNKKEWENLLFSLKQKSIKLPSFQKMLTDVEEEK